MAAYKANTGMVGGCKQFMGAMGQNVSIMFIYICLYRFFESILKFTAAYI